MAGSENNGGGSQDLAPTLDPGESGEHQALVFARGQSEIHGPGTQLGSYKVIRLIGEGGIGRVYLAEHVKLGRQVALKKLRGKYAADKSIVHRFFAEARAANQIAHEHIVQITDFIEDEHGCFLIMELLDGADLSELLYLEGALTIERALHILIQVASALDAAHQAGIVHRDLKPDNIFLIQKSRISDFVKVLDFGIAKLVQGDEPQPDDVFQTGAGVVLGTPAYMSPEQACGHAIDARTDIYSFGVIAYETLTGRLPLEAKTLGEFVIKHTTVDPDPPSQQPDILQPIPPRLDELILRCLAKETSDRPATMGEVEAALKAIAESLGVADPMAMREPTGTQPIALEPVAATPEPAPPRRGLWLGVSAMGLLALALVAALSLGGDPPEPEPVAEPRPVQTPEITEPEQAAPEMVSLSFHSSPEGAEVWQAGADAPLGVTPLAITREQEDTELVFELRKEGYESAHQTVSLVESFRAVVSLTPSATEPVAEEPPPRAKRRVRRARARMSAMDQPTPMMASRRMTRSGTLDPFAM